MGNTIIMVTHNPNLTSYATRVINMLDGRVASDVKIAVQMDDIDTAIPIQLNRHTTKAPVEEEIIVVKKKPRKRKKESKS